MRPLAWGCKASLAQLVEHALRKGHGLEPHRRLLHVALAPLLKPTQPAFCWQGIVASYWARAHGCS